MKCLVLGGGGFIGSSVSDRLLLDGHLVRVLARPKLTPYRAFGPEEPMEWIRGDFLNVHDLREAVRGIDVVIHLVSTTVPKTANDDPIWDVQSNLIGSLQLFQVLQEQSVSKIIFISSGGTVYGPTRYLPIDENHPTNPLTAYGITKLAIEKHLQMFTHLHGVPSIILRVSNPYGERQRIETAQGAVGVFLNRALSGVPIEIWGDGTTTRDYIHISDVAAAVAYAIKYDGEEQIFNVGTGQGTSLNTLVDLIGLVIGHPVEKVYKPARTFDVPISVLDIARIREALEWFPQIDMHEGLVLTLAGMHSEPLRHI